MLTRSNRLAVLAVLPTLALCLRRPALPRPAAANWTPAAPDAGALLVGGAETGPRIDALHPAAAEVELVGNKTIACSRARNTTLENAVVVYLITRISDVDWLVNRAMPRVWKRYLQHWPYPVVVFVPSSKMREYDPSSYGSSPSAVHLREQLGQIGLPENIDLTVHEFDLTFPKTLGTDWQRRMNTCASMVNTQYKHMNQFFTKIMYEHPALKDYKYYMRLDADIIFTRAIDYDPFCMIKETGRKFMFQTRHHVRDPSCSDGMWEWFNRYAEKHGLVARDTRIWGPSAAFGTYVGYIGVGSLDFFRSSQVRALAAAFNEDGRVYLNRWSDQTYYVLLLALLEDHSAVGDIGLNLTEEAWCHKCKVNRTTVGELIGRGKRRGTRR